MIERLKVWWGRFLDHPIYHYATWPPLVSVILPTHNRVQLLLDRAIPSVLNQTYRNFELLVVAHGCTDGTADRVLKAAQDNRVYAFSIPREVYYPDTPENRWFTGPVDPLNYGLKLSRGRWIARIDDDDEWTSDCLEILVRHAVGWDLEFVSAMHETHRGPVEPYDLDGVQVGGCQTWLYRDYLKTLKYDRNCYKKRWDRVNDTDLQRRFRDAGVRMGYIPRVVARVLPRPGQTEVGHAAL